MSKYKRKENLMELTTIEKRFDDIISSYSNDAGKAIEYCSEDNGYAFQFMREASEKAMQSMKALLVQYLRELD